MSGYRSRQPRRSRGVAPALRAATLARASHQCQIRGPMCAGVAAQADHIIPWFEGGADALDNLQAACDPCHKDKTQGEAQRARAKFSRNRPAPRHPIDALRASVGRPRGGEPLPGRSRSRTA